MRRYSLTVGERSFTVEVAELGADRFSVWVDGRTFEVGLTAQEDLPTTTITPAITPAGESGHALRRGASRADAGAATPVIAGSSSQPGAGPVEPATPAAPVAPRPATGPAGSGTMRSPMPGVVLEVLVAPGAQVKRGDPVLVLEAMKLRNTLRAPIDGTVAEVGVRPGQSVGFGDTLLVFGDAAR